MSRKKGVLKRMLSISLIVMLIVTMIPFVPGVGDKVLAVTTPPIVSKTTILERIAELESCLSGKFFTTDGYRANDSGDDRCNVVNVLNQNTTVRNLIYKNKGKTGYRPDANSYLPSLSNNKKWSFNKDYE